MLQPKLTAQVVDFGKTVSDCNIRRSCTGRTFVWPLVYSHRWKVAGSSKLDLGLRGSFRALCDRVYLSADRIGRGERGGDNGPVRRDELAFAADMQTETHESCSASFDFWRGEHTGSSSTSGDGARADNQVHVENVI